MKLVLCLLAVIITRQSAMASYSGFTQHKSESELAQMTPEQLVEEYCREYRHRYDVLDRYRNLVVDYISRDAVKAMYLSARIIDQYDPTTREEGRSQAKGDRADAARNLLNHLDETVIRLRASEEGRSAIESVGQLVRRMERAHFNATDTYDYWRQGRYRILLIDLQEIEGINQCDEAIRHTLKLKYKIALSDQALLDFLTYLIAKDPHYPGWSKREEYKDLTQRNEAGYPIWYLIMKNPEPYYKAYVEYQAQAKPPANSQ